MLFARSVSVSYTHLDVYKRQPYNNRCDELATAAADSRQWLIDEGFEQEESHPTLL